MILLAATPTWLSLAARYAWLGELSTHFTAQYCLVLPLALAVCWRARWPRLAVFVGIALTISVARVAPLCLPAAAGPEQGPRLRLLTQNVYKPNGHHDLVRALVERESPDVFLLLEVNRKWIDGMGPLAQAYPHSAHQLRGTRSGVAIYSKLPLEEVRFEKLGPIDRLTVMARVEVDGRQVTLIGAHPSLPRRPQNLRWRNDELLAIADVAAATEGPVVVMGDLNTTPFSPIFGDVLRAGDLRDSAQGYGVQPTWSWGGRWPLLLPIDHLLHSADVAVVDRRVGPDVGSDHRAVMVDLVVGEAP